MSETITHSTASYLYCSVCGKGPMTHSWDYGCGPVCLICYDKATAAQSPKQPDWTADGGVCEICKERCELENQELRKKVAELEKRVAHIELALDTVRHGIRSGKAITEIVKFIDRALVATPKGDA